jgi:photosystem II stability/assembly factor-like uncharacterized protein
VKVFTRNRVVALALVGAFVVAFFAIGAFSSSSPPTVTPPADAEPVPTATWYWAMAVSPSDPNVLVLGTSSGLFRSTDGGGSWKETGPKPVHVTSLAHVGDSLIAGGVRKQPNTSPVVWKGTARVAPDGPGVLLESTDEGLSWDELEPDGLPKTTVQALAVDPEDETALYALLNTGKLYRSSDGAGSFDLVASKLEAPPWSLAITEHGGFVAGSMDSGHYLSPDGETWKQTAYRDSEGARHVMEYAVKPDDPSRVLMTSTGVEASTDGGRTWEVVLPSEEMFGPIAWSLTNDDVAYAVGFDHSLWRSDDAGENWTKVS